MTEPSMTEPIMNETTASDGGRAPGVWQRVFAYLCVNKLVVLIPFAIVTVGGFMASPFACNPLGVPRASVPVDAIPDTGENQQIVFTEWPGRSPRDIEDQITYPLTTMLLSVAGVRTVRSQSMFGFSAIYVIFDDGIDFFWSRERLLERISSLPPGTLPDDVSPRLGPEATALGQIFWYTLQGRDGRGEVVGGWDRDELRSIQDWTIRYALQSVDGVAEVSSIGGFVREYQVDINPESLAANRVSLHEVAQAVRHSNQEIGARTLEINGAEYIVRSRGFIDNISDIEASVVAVRNHVPVRVRDVARVSLGPADRRGALDDAGAEAVGGVVVARYGANPREVIAGIKRRIAEIAPTLPTRTLADGTESQVTIVPFYDRTTLIDETVATLGTALRHQILITILVVLLMLRHVRSAALISCLVPVAVLLTFLAMKLSGVGANIMSLAGIAIAIGTMVDVGIIMTENIVRHVQSAPKSADRVQVISAAAAEVAPAIVTSVATTIISFLPIFALTASEGKLFRPLAFTKSYALAFSAVLGIALLPVLAHLLMGRWLGDGSVDEGDRSPARLRRFARIAHRACLWIGAAAVAVVLGSDWQPLGIERHPLVNIGFVAVIVGLLLVAFAAFQRGYRRMLRWCLANKVAFLIVPCCSLIFAATAWLGFAEVFAWLPGEVAGQPAARRLAERLPGISDEYMPALDEGSFLVMPSTMAHASFGQSLELLQQMDAAIAQIPEVDRVVGKLGRADTALDPAPVSMFETLVTYKPQYQRDDAGRLVRNWRPHIRSPADIWHEIAEAARLPGITPVTELMPIETRRIMLQTGMRGSMGVRLRGPDLATLERAVPMIESLLRTAEAIGSAIDSTSVSAERVVGKPYLELELDRSAIAHHGLRVADVQECLSIALGGMPLTRTVEGRERYPVRVRYMREERDTLEALQRLLIATPDGQYIPLAQLGHFEYVRGPQVIKSEDTFKTAYVTFDKIPGVSEVDAVQRARAHIERAIASGELELPEGVSYEFAGNYENQVRSKRRILILIPITLALVFLLLYLQFQHAALALIIYSGVLVAVSGGFVLLWLYAQPGFLDLSVFAVNLRELFQVDTINMSVAVWVGVIALIGIATDDGVVMATYLDQSFAGATPRSVAEVRALVQEAGARRVRPCLMTTATTLLALLPVLTATGRGADIMVPMAVPIFGGMAIEAMTLFVVPVLYCARAEWQLAHSQGASQAGES